MTTTSSRTSARHDGHWEAEAGFWRDHTQINLSPLAAPSILGLFGFAASTFMVAANLAGWYGNETTTPLVLAPFAFAFGGVAQFLAAMWSYRARDALATGIHGAWGSFWIGYGIYNLLVAVDVLPGTASSGTAAVAFGYWFIGLAAITWTGMVAALAENLAVSLVLLTLAAGSTFLAIGLVGGWSPMETTGAYLLLASAALAWYTASAMVLEATYKRVVLPVGKRGAEPNMPGARPTETIQFQLGEPGVKAGQ